MNSPLLHIIISLPPPTPKLIINGTKSMVSKSSVFLILLCVVMNVVGCYVCCCENQGVWTEWEKQLRRRRFSSAAASLFGRLATTKPMPAGNGHQTQWSLIMIEGGNDIHHSIHNVYIGIQFIKWFNIDINMKNNEMLSSGEQNQCLQGMGIRQRGSHNCWQLPESGFSDQTHTNDLFLQHFGRAQGSPLWKKG